MYKRSEKVAEAIHELVSELLIKGLKDPRIGFVTITGVKVTDDLHLATVYFTVIGSEEEKKATGQGLQQRPGVYPQGDGEKSPYALYTGADIPVRRIRAVR